MWKRQHCTMPMDAFFKAVLKRNLLFKTPEHARAFNWGGYLELSTMQFAFSVVFTSIYYIGSDITALQITLLNTVPDINMLVYLPEFLDGLFLILGESSAEVKKM